MLSVGLIAIGTGCVLPPPVTSLEDVENRPPRIIPRSLTPDPLDGPYQLRCRPQLFFAEVEDPDPDDVLYWRIFFDFADDPSPFEREIRTLHPTGPTPISFTVDQQDELLDGPPGSVHTIELFVSDRPLDDSPTAKPPGHSPEVGGLTDSFVWTVLQSECAP